MTKIMVGDNFRKPKDGGVTDWPRRIAGKHIRGFIVLFALSGQILERSVCVLVRKWT